jgi:hypothetical protein
LAEVADRPELLRAFLVSRHHARADHLIKQRHDFDVVGRQKPHFQLQRRPLK